MLKPSGRGERSNFCWRSSARSSAACGPAAQWVYVLVTILVVLPLIAAFFFANEIHAVYLREFAAPRLEREFGFKGGRISMQSAGYTGEVFAIIAVTPGGALQKAGVEPGDIPVGYKHGFETGFLQDLIAAEEGRAVEVRLARSPDLSRWKTAHISSLSLFASRVRSR